MGAIVLSAVLAASVSLPDLLKTLSVEEKQKEELGRCSFTERTVLEELDKSGKALGQIERSYAIVRDPVHIDRKQLSKKVSGEVSSALQADPKDPTPEERKKQRSPFHPEEQPRYRFAIAHEGDGKVLIRFEPIEKDEKRLKGTIEVDLASSEPLSMKAEPSAYPKFLHELALEMRFAKTACGIQPVRLQTRGVGGFLFLKKRFRSDSQLEGYERR